MSTCAIVDYESGNLHSAAKSFQRASDETNGPRIIVTADPDAVRAADRIVLPGVGAFADCRRGLLAVPGMYEAVEEKVHHGTPFFGICVGMQLLASVGREFGDTPGFGWLPGEVVHLRPADPGLKIPHMGWNALAFDRPHPLFRGVEEGAHAYFVHSYHYLPQDPGDRIATVHYGQSVTAALGRDNIFGTQFHPEKSQSVGLRVIANFLHWTP
ncbi:MAG: imidazole glycerol phosphate synthase subunit HisH [Rubricella sp.]